MGGSNSSEGRMTAEDADQSRRNIFHNLDTKNERWLKEYFISAIHLMDMRDKYANNIMTMRDWEPPLCNDGNNISNVYERFKHILGRDNVKCDKVRDDLNVYIRAQVSQDTIMTFEYTDKLRVKITKNNNPFFDSTLACRDRNAITPDDVEGYIQRARKC
jgi:hypothetical protein